MKLTLSAFSICRTPVFSIHEKPEQVWDKLKVYIHESSPEFYQLIKDHDYSGICYADPKIRFTVWKYFNRARYRATPYGNFAAFSIVPVSKELQASHIILSTRTTLHRFPNWQEKESINLDPKFLSNHARYVKTNTTGYFCNQELRYVNIEDSSFELSAISASKTIAETLKFCRSTRTLAELRHFLQYTQGLKPSLSRYFTEQLIGTQLLLTDFQPNITGTDYFSRIGYHSEKKKNDYIIAERARASGQLSEKSLLIIPEIISFLNHHLPAAGKSSLIDFKTQFIKRFDQKKVPLMVAMDPEIGIGYRSLTQNKAEDQLVCALRNYRQQATSSTNNISYTSLHNFLLNGMMQHTTIQLEKFKGDPQRHPVAIPNTLSAIIQYSDEKVIIKQLGGCTANSLLGRFSMAGNEITAAGKRFAEIEQEANPGVLFFDVAYQLEKNADNINRRKCIYPYEMPILSWSESGQVIDPDDILLSVENAELVLHSVKYKKRIVPKLASAYNYTRSDLSVYRFLSDLQHQNIRSDLNIHLTDLFPGLFHYPRLQYKHAVLSPARWLIPENICSGRDKDQTFAALMEWMKEIDLKTPFKCGFADQTLIFDPHLKEDMNSFLLFCKNKTQLYIEEAFIPGSHLIHDERGQPYLSEFIVNTEHQQQVYHPYPLQQKEDLTHIKSAFLPGEEWLYFEIYCHPANSDSLLQIIARDYLRSVKNKLMTWFFIRYSDPSYHIRLRFKPRRNEDIAELISKLSLLLAPYFEAGIISDLQLRTYQRETERYGPERIEMVEYCFKNDSNLVLYLISKAADVHHCYYQSMLLLEKVMADAAFSAEQQLSFVETTAAQFAAEMSIPSEGSKKINIGYKTFLTDTAALQLSKVNEKKILATADGFTAVLEKCDTEEKERMVFDLFHMHTNRLFSTDQRVHEMIMYYYLTKKIKTRLHRHQSII
jgi:thiopeptide-type bacteriocin biosynthesis protein